MKQNPKPKILWYATLNFRQAGRWLPNETFNLKKPYETDGFTEVKCHVLYETAMEAFLSLYKEIEAEAKKKSTVSIFVYSVKPTYLNKGSYYSPEMLMETEHFTCDRDLFTRHLIRQSCTFTREANLKIRFSDFVKEPIQQLCYTDITGNEKFLTRIRKPTVEMTFGSLSRYQTLAVEKALFDIGTYPFKQPVYTKPLEAEKPK